MAGSEHLSYRLKAAPSVHLLFCRYVGVSSPVKFRSAERCYSDLRSVQLSHDLQISLLGEIRVASGGVPCPLPASRKARALLAFLAVTGRPHRRERLCELFWDLPDDPKASLRWALSKLRRVVDAPDHRRIIADRERISFDTTDVCIDITSLRRRLLQQTDPLPLKELETAARQLDAVLLDGVDGAGSQDFDSWLITERDDAQGIYAAVLRQLAIHPETDPVLGRKWRRLWRQADPQGWDAHELQVAAKRARPSPPPPVKERDPAARTRASDLQAFEAPVTGVGSSPARTRTRVEQYKAQAMRAQRIGFCEVRDRTKIAYATLGSGPPLLKAANWLNHLEFDWNSPIWGRSFAEIARHRTFVRYDERGCGLSDWEVEDLSFDAFVEDLEAVADKLELERFPLLGISQGCAVSIEYAVRHPERVSGLILIGGYAAGWRHLTSPEEQARREAVLTLTELGWGTDNPAYRQIFSQTFMPEATKKELDWFNEFQRRTTSPHNAARFQDSFGHIDVRHRLAQVTAPTIVLHSRHDQRIPFDVGRSLAAEIPDAQFIPLESRNHVLVESEPAWRTCFDAVGQFLAEKRI